MVGVTCHLTLFVFQASSKILLLAQQDGLVHSSCVLVTVLCVFMTLFPTSVVSVNRIEYRDDEDSHVHFAVLLVRFTPSLLSSDGEQYYSYLQANVDRWSHLDQRGYSYRLLLANRFATRRSRRPESSARRAVVVIQSTTMRQHVLHAPARNARSISLTTTNAHY